jgi:hypothetical protein
MKSLIFVISALAIFAGTASAQFNPVAWAQSRDYSRNFVQYVANPYNKTEFYQCEKVRGAIKCYLQACHKCFEFSDDLWTCVQVSYVDCLPTEAPITEIITYGGGWCYVKGNGAAGLYEQAFKVGSVRWKYIWDIGGGTEVEMSCPPGTYFNFTECRCLWCDGNGCAGFSNRVFTLDFDTLSLRNGIYFDVDPAVELVEIGSRHLPKFNGVSANIEVPFFQNNEFREFTFTVKFYRDSAGSTGEQGILYNGGKGTQYTEDFYPASIYVLSLNPNQVKAGIRAVGENNVVNTFNIISSAVVSTNQWVEVIFRYNGTSLDLWVNGVYDTTPASGVTERLKDDLKFGQSYDFVSQAPYFFQGILDSPTWYRTAVPVPIPPEILPPN